VKTTHRSVTKLKIYPGFNKALLDTFKIKVNVKVDQSKLCCIVFEELAIKLNVACNPEHDEVQDVDVGKCIVGATNWLFCNQQYSKS